MPRYNTRRKQRHSRKKQRGGVHLVQGQLVKIKPERFEAFKKSLEVDTNSSPRYPDGTPFLINPEDTYLVIMLSITGKNQIMSFAPRAPITPEEEAQGFHIERIFIPKNIIVSVPFNNRLELSQIPKGTRVDTFTDLSTAQAMLLTSEKRFVTQFEPYVDINPRCDLIEEGLELPETLLANYHDVVHIFRNQIVMPEDSKEITPKQSLLTEMHTKFARLPNIKLTNEYLAPFEALARRENDEMVKFRAFQQHRGNCWSDAFFAILFEASALKEFTLPVILKLVAFEQKTYGTTLLAANPTLLPAMAAFVKSEYNLTGIHEQTVLFFMNGFQRYINKIVQYIQLQKRAAVGAALAPTASLNIETVEEYQVCYNPKRLLPPRPNTVKNVGGSFRRDLLVPTEIFLNAIAPDTFKILQIVKVDEKSGSIGRKPLVKIPEAYYFNISSKEVSNSGGAANSPKNIHRRHAVCAYRKLGLPELPEGIWYFYDDNTGVSNLSLEDSNKLNSVGIDTIRFSHEEAAWTIQLRSAAALPEEQSRILVPSTRYKFNFSIDSLFVFIKKTAE